MSINIKPAQATLNSLRDGQVMNELAQSIHDATAAVQQFGKAAEVCLTIKLRPLGSKGVSDAIEAVADVSTKLPKQEPPSTLFFIDRDGNPSRTQDRQQDLPGVTVINGEGGKQ